MNIKKHAIKVGILIFLVLLATCLKSNTPNEVAPPSLADHLHLSHSKDPVDGGWLPQLIGLPDNDQVVLLTQRVLNVVKEETDPQCASIAPHLRTMIFQHFLIYQQMVNAQGIYFDEQIVKQWAHVLAMVLKESSGDSSSITSFSNGDSLSTYKAETNLQRWRQILNLTKQSRIQMNYQTNFGLTQLSPDRLFSAFRLAQDQSYDTAFLEGKEGAETPRKIALNTAIAIRRIIWFYQDFAQGRIVDSDTRIHQQDINNPVFAERYQMGLQMALLYCGTNFLFSEGYLNSSTTDHAQLQNAMASIAYCKLGNPHTGYGVNQMDEDCFAQWVTLCPALNIDIATLTPLSYFASQGQSPVCENSFRQLMNKGPGAL